MAVCSSPVLKKIHNYIYTVLYITDKASENLKPLLSRQEKILAMFA